MKHVSNHLSVLFSLHDCTFKLVFNSFKIKNYFSYKHSIPDDLKSFLVYKFTCTSYSSSYIGKTCRHFKNRIGHIKKDNNSHIFKHLLSTYYSSFLKIINRANSKFYLNIKETLHTNWRKCSLNAQQIHLAPTLSL